MTFINEAAREFEAEALALHREKVIRECIAALPAHYPNDSYTMLNLTIDNCREALESLLPKPDRAKELVEERWDSAAYRAWDNARIGQCVEIAFGRWLITEKGIKLP